MATAEQFIKQWIAAGLVTRGDVDDFLATVSNPPQTAEDLAKAAIRHGKLTKFQAQLIYQGKGKSLTLGNYLILEKLGQGGMGQVFLATHRRMKRQVALKVLPAKFMGSAKAVERFHREVEAAARLAHPNIVTAYDADEHRGVHYFVMEHVDGKDLASVIRGTGPLTVERAVDVTLQAARGLAFAHDHGVVHRDVKPGNILLSTTGQVKILDMGLACLADGDGVADHGLTGTGMIMGTVDFMAPEQGVNTKNADARADQYALGATLYFLLTGRPLYGGETAVEKILAHRDHPIPDLQTQRPDVPARLAKVFTKMVAKRPEDRYPHMAAAITALEGVSQSAADSVTDDALQEFLKIREVESMPTLIEPPAPLQAPVATKPVTKPRTKKKRAQQETLQSGFLSDTQTVQPSVASPPPPQPPRRLSWVAAGVLGVAMLLGGIIIRIRGKDGSVTEINVPDGATVEVVQEPTTPRPAPIPKADEIDFITEREVAEWVRSIGGSGQWIDVASGNIGSFNPDTPLPLFDVALHEAYLGGNQQVTDDDLKRFTKCQRLSNLSLNWTAINGSGLQHLASVQTLATLDLNNIGISGNELTDDELAFLGSLGQLKWLSLANNWSLTDVAILHLKGLVNLEHLDLYMLRITDVGLSYLGDTPRINGIVIGSTGVPVSFMCPAKVLRSRCLTTRAS
jgi:serine/threonine protein kinase